MKGTVAPVWSNSTQFSTCWSLRPVASMIQWICLVTCSSVIFIAVSLLFMLLKLSLHHKQEKAGSLPPFHLYYTFNINNLFLAKFTFMHKYSSSLIAHLSHLLNIICSLPYQTLTDHEMAI